MPTSRRPPLTTSSTASSSARSTGWCKGNKLTPMPSRRVFVRGDERGQYLWRRAQAVVVEVMLGDPHGGIAEGLGGQHLREAGIVDALLAPCLVTLHQKEQPEFHSRPPSRAYGDSILGGGLTGRLVGVVVAQRAGEGARLTGLHPREKVAKRRLEGDERPIGMRDLAGRDETPPGALARVRRGLPADRPLPGLSASRDTDRCQA